MDPIWDPDFALVENPETSMRVSQARSAKQANLDVYILAVGFQYFLFSPLFREDYPVD